MSEEAKSEIAASRALYFSELKERSPPGSEERVKRPSYVGISNSLNGYTPYAPYRTLDAGRKISPPLHLPTNPTQPLDSVSLVLNQDGFQRSIAEFHETMRDFNMGRQTESADITDNGSMMHVGDQFYPASHIKQVIDTGDKKSVTTITQFHSGGKQNLVSKQIERLYGGDPLAQIRLTSPEPQVRNNKTIDSNGTSDDVTPSPERKISGGFFAKRFGVTKMKDHSTLKSPETPKEYKPLKVPAVFKLLRPEFREQLKQSSCKVSMPEDGGKERIIPIRMENSPSSRRSSPASHSSSTPSSAERIIPITRLSNGDRSTTTTTNGVSTPTNGVSTPTNGVSTTINGDRSTYTNGHVVRSPVSLSNGAVNGSSVYSTTPTSAPGLRRSVPTVIGFRSPPLVSEKEVPAKPLVIRKLSPLSPKHIVCSSKPAPAPKPEHLMSPPMSPVPSEENRSPALSRNGSLPSPTPKEEPEESVEVQEEEAVSPAVDTTPAKVNGQVPVTQTKVPADRNDSVPSANLNGGIVAADRNGGVPPADQNGGVPVKENGWADVSEDASPEEMEEVSEKDMEPMEEFAEYDDDNQYPQYFQCGLRERELLCPILEEDNESTASGSVVNLQTNCPSGIYSSDDPLLLTEQGEIQDGHYFIKVLENEIFKFEEQICDFEEELSMSSDIPEDCRENILSTVGLAKLLMAQKLAQFRGLCDKNISVSKEEDPFVPTSQDLAGFWDMVHIQVEQVHGKFANLQKLRSNGWKEKVEEKKPKVRKGTNKNVNKPIKPKEKSEAAKARDEARKKMLDARKKAMKEKQPESDLIIIM